MRCRLLLVVVMLSAAIGGGVMPVRAQTAKARSKAWTPARTPDGQPDLQGVWTNPTITPFERPAELAGKATLTAAEAAALEKKAAEKP